MAADLSAYPDRESELTHALAAMRSRLAAAAEAAGRNVGEIELLPITKFFPATDVAILFRLGCRSVGESREQEASAKMAELNRLLAAAELGHSGCALAHGGPDSTQQSRVAGSLGAHRSLGGQLAVGDRAGSGGCCGAGRTPSWRAAAGLRQVSLDGDGSRAASTARRPAP